MGIIATATTNNDLIALAIHGLTMFGVLWLLFGRRR